MRRSQRRANALNAASSAGTTASGTWNRFTPPCTSPVRDIYAGPKPPWAYERTTNGWIGLARWDADFD